MFETVAPVAAARRSRSALYEALTFSLFVHAAAGLFMLGSNLWQVSFPAQSPPFNVAFVLEAPEPPPPPPPPKPKLAEPEQKAAVAPLKAPEAFVAPTVIPDTIPVVKPEAFTPVALAVPDGVIGGSPEGEDTGRLGGTKGGGEGGVIGSVVPPPPDDGRVHFSRDEKLPLISVQQDYPDYPETARKHGWEDELVVRYVIGKNGRVKEVTVIEPPSRDLFIEGTLEAIRSWRFRPFVKDGQRQEVVHELTIYYRLTTHAG